MSTNGTKSDEETIPLVTFPTFFIKWRVAIVCILILVNLLNYMDRFVIAGLLNQIQNYYGLNEKQLGLLQTSFIVFYMLLSPIFGYVGDRFNRKYLILFGISLWSFITFASSFVPSDNFWLFLCMRGLVGIGEASYATVAPAILADLYNRNARTTVLALFYFAIPIGSGLGFVGSTMVGCLTDKWQWALRMTPTVAIILLLLIIVYMRDPPRGMAEKATNVREIGFGHVICSLCGNLSYICVTVGFACMTFVTGSLAWWAVYFVNAAINNQKNDPLAYTHVPVPILFGICTCIGGISGILLSMYLAKYFRKYTTNADCFICTAGMILSVPFLYFAFVICRYSFLIALLLNLFGTALLSLNWALTAEMTISVVLPNRRSTANALQSLFSHMFGDAASPYLIGLLADTYGHDAVMPSLSTYFLTLRNALFLNLFICVMGGAAYLFCSIFYEDDVSRVTMLFENCNHSEAILCDDEQPQPGNCQLF